MNVFTFTGNLGKDCRTATVGGNQVCNFSVAVKEGFGKNAKTHWIECALWGERGSALSHYLTKGASVAVSGEFGMREATDQYKAVATCRVASVTLIGGAKADTQERPAAAKPAQSDEAPSANFDDSIPF